jgi:hypothetical protein
VSDVLAHEDLFLVRVSRRWVRHGRGNLVERIAFAYQPYAIGVPFLRTLPLALDASMLVNQVAYVARKRRSGLLEAADLGLVRLYAGETIAGEVERNLIKRAASGRHSARELFGRFSRTRRAERGYPERPPRRRVRSRRTPRP